MNIERWSCLFLVLVLSGCASSGGNTVTPVSASAVALDDEQVRSIGNLPLVSQAQFARRAIEKPRSHPTFKTNNTFTYSRPGQTE
jgi:hypothetical protein